MGATDSAPEALAPRAVEETMHYIGAVRATVRVASCDVVYNCVVIPEGAVVATKLAAVTAILTSFSMPKRSISQPPGLRNS